MKRTLAVPSGLAGLALLSLAAPTLFPSVAPPPPAPLIGGPTPINMLPFPITTPGSYCLTGNLTGGPGIGGITVGADNVVIDLGGFVLDGADEFERGISTFREHLVIRNGTIRNWGDTGILAQGKSEVSDVRVSGCGRQGINIGFASLVRNCVLDHNGAAGADNFNLRASSYSLVENCRLIEFDAEVNLYLDNYAIARGIEVFGGVTGVRLSNGTRLEDCTVRDYQTIGIDADTGCSISQTTLDTTFLNPEAGIRGLDRTRVSESSVSGLHLVGILTGNFSSVVDSGVDYAVGDGIRVGDSCRVTDCIVSLCNASLASGGGIVAGLGTRVDSCTSSYNGGAGILFPSDGGVVSNCDSFQNHLAGISQGGAGWTQNNWVVGNAAEGLMMTGDTHCIEDNVVDSNDRGIVLQGRNSLVKGNRAAKNTQSDFTIPFGNPTGPINQHSGMIGGSVPQANFKTPF